MLKALVLSCACALAFFLIHVAVFSLRPIRDRFKAMNLIMLLCLAAYVVLFAVLPSEEAWSAALFKTIWPAFPRGYTAVSLGVGVLIYLMLYMGYLEFYFTADRSMTVRILREIERTGGRGLSPEDVEKIYDTRHYYLRRYDEMLASGYLRREGEKYINTGKGSRVARLYDFVIRSLHLEGG